MVAIESLWFVGDFTVSMIMRPRSEVVLSPS